MLRCAALGYPNSSGCGSTDVTLQPHPSIRCTRQRAQGALSAALESRRARRCAPWLAVRGQTHTPEVFVNARREPMSRAGFEYILDKYVHVASQSCPSLAGKRVSPHVLRHTCALTMLEATKDIRKVSLWLGHAHMQTTEMYTAC
ncbi:MAG: tyrosine-type recombinase/integrase [Burkholderiaceae bacterium]